MLRNIANQTTTSNIQNPDYNDALTGRADQALQQLYGAVRASQNATSDASGRLATSMGQYPNLSGVAGYLAKLGDAFGQPQQEDPSQSYNPFQNLTWAQANGGW